MNGIFSDIRKNKIGYLLIAPAIICMLMMSVYPLISGIVMSFQNNNMIQASSGNIGKFIGFRNYGKLFKNDEMFFKSLINTGVWVFFNFIFQMFLGTTAALLLNSKFKLRPVYRTFVLIPWIVPSVVAALNWRWMYDSKNGIINILLQRMGFIDEGITWLGEISTAMPAVIVESIWKGTPFVMLLILAGLQTIPKDMDEAAYIDGAGRFRTLISVTLPYIKESILIAGILTIIHTINNFNAIWLMTAGGPLGSTEILFTYAYRKAFMQYDFGVSASISTIIFSIVAVLTFFYIRIMKWGKE
ncbi:carbohydrate ABC transporter permease [Breznakiella homolactica]|uniref:Sugar ABC transporter permease n=1 Tax=Breznakiella homolactica TaxID=2798577 RepID=A0A7T7XR19_9SPIR|nr:sugar ABC transporter permease [Breznakiella homolactica]QQO10828.1 sugar ABC transporter permease [Breznakiella homolactica]